MKSSNLARILTGFIISIAAILTTGSLAMSNDDTDKRHQEFLDKQFPFIEEGAEPPGRWVEGLGSSKVVISDGHRHWEGPTGWRTRQGKTIVAWSLGKPHEVTNALLPDGTRGDVRRMLDFGFRRRSSGPRRYVYGTIDVRPDDAIFTDAVDQPIYSPPPITDVPNLEAELARDEAFLKSLQNDRFAEAVYAVFVNRDFLKGKDERRWLCGDRQAARLVRDLRGLGESYQDYFLHEFPGIWPDDLPEREAHLRKSIEKLSTPIEAPTFEEAWSQVEKLNRHRAKLYPDLPAPSQEQLNERKKKVRRQLEASAAEFAKRLPEMEAQRKQRLKDLESTLATLLRGDNADVFEELRDHLTRLGWRTETAEDRARAAQTAREVRLAVLREIKTLELRPEGTMPEWARPIGTSRGRGGTGWTTLISVSNDETAEELEARAVGPRLEKLAKSGKITKEEYERLNQSLKGQQGRY
jgi:hypothetical protein